MTSLTRAEAKELRKCESVIERGIGTFIEVGTALLMIHDLKLYRAQYSTFDQYCKERWDIGRRRAYQMIDAAKIVGNLKTIDVTMIEPTQADSMCTTVHIPINERQIRPLALLSPDSQREAWAHAVKTAPGGCVTADHVQATVDKLFPRQEPQKPAASSKSEQERSKLADRLAQLGNRIVCTGDTAMIEQAIRFLESLLAQRKL